MGQLYWGQLYWWCPKCGEEVDGTHVSYQELHDACGHPVEVVALGDPIDLLRKRVAELKDTVRALVDLVANGPRHAHRIPGIWDDTQITCEDCKPLVAAERILRE